jgi:hypothetical protein
LRKPTGRLERDRPGVHFCRSKGPLNLLRPPLKIQEARKLQRLRLPKAAGFRRSQESERKPANRCNLRGQTP